MGKGRGVGLKGTGGVKEGNVAVQGKKYKEKHHSPSNIPANPSTSISLAFVFISCNSN